MQSVLGARNASVSYRALCSARDWSSELHRNKNHSTNSQFISHVLLQALLLCDAFVSADFQPEWCVLRCSVTRDNDASVTFLSLANVLVPTSSASESSAVPQPPGAVFIQADSERSRNWFCYQILHAASLQIPTHPHPLVGASQAPRLVEPDTDTLLRNRGREEMLPFLPEHAA